MYRDYLSSIMNKKYKYIGGKKIITKYNKKPDNTLTSTLSQTLSSSQSRDTTKTGLPYGVQVKQITLPTSIKKVVYLLFLPKRNTNCI